MLKSSRFTQEGNNIFSFFIFFFFFFFFFGGEGQRNLRNSCIEPINIDMVLGHSFVGRTKNFSVAFHMYLKHDLVSLQSNNNLV